MIHYSRIKTSYWPKIKNIVGYCCQSDAKQHQNDVNLAYIAGIPAKMAVVKELQLVQCAHH